MMRKLLVLVVVLAMTSVASGQIIDIVISSLNGQPITPTDNIVITPSEYVNLDIIYIQDEASNLMALDAYIMISGPGTLDLTELTWPYDDGFNQVLDVDPPTVYGLTTAQFSVGMADGILIDHILVHCDDLGEVLVWVAPSTDFGGSFYVDGPYDGAWGPGVSIIQVPEPMTMALLGLGGLFLLRRRK